MKLLLRFWCLEVLPVCLQREVKPFIIWFYTPLLDYDVSMDEVVELVVVIPTSPRSLKMESEWKSYHRFRIAISARRHPDTGPEIPARGPDNPPPLEDFVLQFLLRTLLGVTQIWGRIIRPSKSCATRWWRQKRCCWRVAVSPCAWWMTSPLGTPRGRYDECSG
jgi:hypothetical protein